MNRQTRILGISGSLRRESHNRTALISNAAQRFDPEGNLTDETTKEFIRQLLRNLVDLTWRIQQP